jgi:hypothetical protein
VISILIWQAICAWAGSTQTSVAAANSEPLRANLFMSWIFLFTDFSPLLDAHGSKFKSQAKHLLVEQAQIMPGTQTMPARLAGLLQK